MLSKLSTYFSDVFVGQNQIGHTNHHAHCDPAPDRLKKKAGIFSAMI
jgi:hypothetical protein